MWEAVTSWHQNYLGGFKSVAKEQRACRQKCVILFPLNRLAG